MSGEIVVREEETALTVSSLKARIERIQAVMKGVMKDHVHFGTIPGCGDKPTLLKPGIDLLASTFQIALATEVIEQDVDADEASYRVRVTATSAVTGRFLGAAEGQASTREKKYRWRRPVHLNEWNAADPERRAVQFDAKGFESKKVRQEPGDVANTILQMAVKRASGALIRTVTACSDIFSTVDSPEEMGDTSEETKPAAAMPRRASGAPAAAAPAAAPVIMTAPGPIAVPASAPADREPGDETTSKPAGLTITFAKVAATGTKQNGQPWKLYCFTTSDGTEWTTFSETIYVAAQKAAEDKEPRVVFGHLNDRNKMEAEEIAPVPKS